MSTCKTCNGRRKVQAGLAGEELQDCPDCQTYFRCETCQEEGTVHIAAIGCHFCPECLGKIDIRIAEIRTVDDLDSGGITPWGSGINLSPLELSSPKRLFWWMPRRTDPLHAGWYYVLEIDSNVSDDYRRLRIGIRYFEDTKGEWWAVSKDGKNDGSMVPNETFNEWMTIPGISDRQGSRTIKELVH